MILFLGAMNGLVLANDLTFVYFFFEITTLCSFLLIGHDRDRERDPERAPGPVDEQPRRAGLRAGPIIVGTESGALQLQTC